MSILNTEDLDRRIVRAQETINRIEKDFSKSLSEGYVPVFLIDPGLEIDLFKVAEESKALYIDLSRPIDYPRLCRIVQDADSIIFDNIDRIPDTEAKEDIQYLVKYALRKEDEVPTPLNTSLCFADYKIGARCRQKPGYLSEGSKAFPISYVVPHQQHCRQVRGGIS